MKAFYFLFASIIFVGNFQLMKKPTKKPATKRRSLCPVACALDMIGDRWTLLVIRDLFLGSTRFKDFASSPESIPTNILSERLLRLRNAGVVEQIPAKDGTKRLAYQLTEKGKSLGPILVAVRDWGLEWEPGTEVKIIDS